MPQEPTAAPAPAGNPANAPGAVVSNAPHPGVVAAQRARAGRADTIALIEAGKLDDVSAKPAPRATPSRPAARVEPVTAPVEPASAADASAADDLESSAELDAKPDPETAKRQAMIQAAEKRSKDKLAGERRELEVRAKAIETEWSPRVQAAEAFEALKAKAAKARSNPALLVDVFRALGYTDDHLEPAAQALYAHSKAGQADPARKAQAERMMRERESTDELEATKRRLDELEGKLTQKDQQGEFRQLQATFLDAALDAVDDATPLAKAVAAKAKGGATPAERAAATKRMAALRGRLWDLTVAMTDELGGDAPDPADVIARYEEMRGAELDELGIARPTATTTDPKMNNQAADKKNPAKTLSADLSTPRVPRDAQGGKDHRAETRRMIESGKLE